MSQAVQHHWEASMQLLQDRVGSKPQEEGSAYSTKRGLGYHTPEGGAGGEGEAGRAPRAGEKRTAGGLQHRSGQHTPKLFLHGGLQPGM